MQITAIKQQVKNPERANVFVDGKYSFSLHLNEVVTEKLRSGFALDDATLKRLKKVSDDGKLKARALEWVLTRPRSERELRDYLRRKKVEPAFAQTVVDDFFERGYLNEQRYAEWLSDVRIRRGKSNRAIQAELASKGIDRETAQSVLSHEDELSRLKEIYVKKSKLPRYKADPQKLIQYLARQGFGYDDIKQVIVDGNQ